MFADITRSSPSSSAGRISGPRHRLAEPDLEISAVIDRVSKSPAAGRAGLREAGRPFDSRGGEPLRLDARICLALGVNTLDELADEIDELTTPPMPKGFMDALKLMPLVNRLTDLMPKTVKDAPCQEVVKMDGGLDELPILKTWPEDGGPFITLPLVFTRDPETGMRNIGTYRMQVFDRRTTGMHWQRHKGGAQHHRIAERLGKRLDVAVALGADPVLTYCATAPMPEGLDELMLAGADRQTARRAGKCRTVDLEVPANAQIVLEGYVEPGERRPPTHESPAGSPSVVLHTVTTSAVPGTVEPAPDRPVIVTFQKASPTSSAETVHVIFTVPVGRTSLWTLTRSVAGASIPASKQSSSALVPRSPMTTMPPSAMTSATAATLAARAAAASPAGSVGTGAGRTSRTRLPTICSAARRRAPAPGSLALA